MTPAAANPVPNRDGLHELRHEYTLNLGPLLAGQHTSLLISTYQAGKVVAVGTRQEQPVLSYHTFEHAVGVAVSRDRIAVGARGHVWFLRSQPDLAPRLAPAGEHDACFLTRAAHVTGDIHIHEMAWAGPELWIVNTRFSCLCTLDDRNSFVPRWKPPFIGLAGEDRCHLNGLALADGRPKYVTCLGRTDTPQGWRPTKVTAGCILDVPSGEVVAQGFAMPHSPRVYGGRLWVLDSGKGQLAVVDPPTGKAEPVCSLPGYARGLSFAGPLAFVGLSKIRETSLFGGVPIAERRDELKCGVGAIDLTAGRYVGHLEFVTGVEEIFSVEALAGVRRPRVTGPFAGVEGGEEIWVVPSGTMA